jgi:hypothetical protein
MSVAKTIAITPSWYWPSGVPRVIGTPPFRVDELTLGRWARRTPEAVALIGRGGSTRWTWRELSEEVHSRLPAIREQAVVDLASAPGEEAVIQLLAGLAAGVPVRAGGVGAVPLADAGAGGAAGADEYAGALTRPAVAVAGTGGTVWHSHRSLVAGGLAFAAFLGIQPAGEATFVTALPLSSWQGIYGAVVPLLAGLAVAVTDPGAAALESARRESAAWLYSDLADATAWTHEAKREVKALRGSLGAAVLSVGGPFDSEQRRRVGRTLGCPALTFFGLPETGPIFASHASWYIDESVGIPVTNAHVVPADPRTGSPLPTLWELVESAMVTVAGPSLCASTDWPLRWLADGRLATGVVASSDPNGMIYLVPS